MSFSANSEVGEYKHTLTVAEIPSHRHDFKYGLSTKTPTAGGYSIQGSSNTRPSNLTFGESNSNYVQSKGDGASHNNIQPSIVVYFWRRTA